MTLIEVLREEFQPLAAVRVWQRDGDIFVELPSPVVEVTCEADVARVRGNIWDRRRLRELAWNAFEAAADRSAVELDIVLCLEGMGSKVPQGYEKVA